MLFHNRNLQPRPHTQNHSQSFTVNHNHSIILFYNVDLLQDLSLTRHDRIARLLFSSFKIWLFCAFELGRTWSCLRMRVPRPLSNSTFLVAQFRRQLRTGFFVGVGIGRQQVTALHLALELLYSAEACCGATSLSAKVGRVPWRWRIATLKITRPC